MWLNFIDAAFKASAQNPHHSLWMHLFSTITSGFSEPQKRQFWRLTNPSRWKFASSLKMILMIWNFQTAATKLLLFFEILFNNEDKLFYRPFLQSLNCQLSIGFFFFWFVNTLLHTYHKWQQIELLREILRHPV